MHRVTSITPDASWQSTANLVLLTQKSLPSKSCHSADKAASSWTGQQSLSFGFGRCRTMSRSLPPLVVSSPQADVCGAVVDHASNNGGDQGIVLAFSKGDKQLGRVENDPAFAQVAPVKHAVQELKEAESLCQIDCFLADTVICSVTAAQSRSMPKFFSLFSLKQAPIMVFILTSSSFQSGTIGLVLTETSCTVP